MSTVMTYVADDAVGCWAESEDLEVWGPACFSDSAWRELEQSGEARVVRQQDGLWDLAPE